MKKKFNNCSQEENEMLLLEMEFAYFAKLLKIKQETH